MKILRFTCRYCGHSEKLLLEDKETILEDGADLGGICWLCFEEYQAKGVEGLEGRRVNREWALNSSKSGT